MRILALAVVSWAMQAQPYISGSTGFRPVAYNVDAAATAGIEAYHRGRYGFPSELSRMSKGQDAVIFDDGELVGPNTSGLDVRWNTERNTTVEIRRLTGRSLGFSFSGDGLYTSGYVLSDRTTCPRPIPAL